MLKRFEGYYDKLEVMPVKGKSLQDLKDLIEKAAGYNSKNINSVFDEYETAWITEFNIFGKRIAQHYFSIWDKKWHRSEIKGKYSGINRMSKKN